jgi:hypothetical protein
MMQELLAFDAIPASTILAPSDSTHGDRRQNGNELGLVVGVLGGGAGTTRDCFELIHQAEKYGARVALFGRKINNAENQLAFIQFLRLIADGEIGPEEAVKAYHGVLKRLGVKPHRTLEKDMELQTNVMNYGGDGVARSLPEKPAKKEDHTACACKCKNGAAEKNGKVNGEPDFDSMTPAQKVAWNKARWDRILG